MSPAGAVNQGDLMGIALRSVDDLQAHLLSVFERSDHHAGEVNEVLLAITGGILWRKNPGDHVRVNEREGAGGNIIWFRIGSQRYAVLYSHRSRRIELMQGGRHGPLIHAFTNATPLAEVMQVFSTLGMSEEEAAAYLAERAEIKARFPKGHKGRHRTEAESPVDAPPAPAETMEPVAMAEPVAVAADKPARRSRKPVATTTAVTKTAPAQPVAEGVAAAKKPAARRSRKASEVAAPEAIQLPLVAIAEPASASKARKATKATTPRKRRTTAKPVPELPGLTVVVATDPLELATAAGPKSRAKSRAKAAATPDVAPALQPA